MQEFQGTLTELGSATVDGQIVKYSYVEIGGQAVKGLKAFVGIKGKLEAALAQGEPVTLYVQSGHVAGVKMADGRLFASGGHGLGKDIFLTVMILGMGLLLSPFIVGIPILLWGVWYFWRLWSFRFAASSLPDAIVV